MSAQDAVDNIRSKQGITNSIDPEYHADQLQLLVDALETFEFDAVSNSRVPLAGSISDDDTDPTLVSGLVLESQNGGFELVSTGPWADTGAILNNTGFDVDCIGSFDIFPDNSGAASRIDMWSETSTDGITISVNDGSARSIEVASSSESTLTKSSKVIGWANGDMLRFAFTDSGGGTIFVTQANVAARGGTVTSPAFSWRLVVTKRTEV